MGEKINAYRVQVIKLVAKEKLPKRTRRWDDNIKRYIQIPRVVERKQ